MPIDSTVAALIGAAIGGVIGVVGTVITAWATSRRERNAFLRLSSQQNADRIRSAYEHALNVLFNLNRGGGPDRATYGNLFAQVALFGSAEVSAMLNAYLEMPAQDRQADLPKFIEAMKRHVEALDGAQV